MHYLEKAIEFVATSSKLTVLDAGCGTGVPTVFIARKLNCDITALDINKDALEYLKDKINQHDLCGRITIKNRPILNHQFDQSTFDLILAEGLLNIIGFEKGLSILSGVLRTNGVLIIHDEYGDQKNKIKIAGSFGMKLLVSFELNEQIWWENYYEPLAQAIQLNKNALLEPYFESDKKEIERIKTDPDNFRSVYYIFKKN